MRIPEFALWRDPRPVPLPVPLLVPPLVPTPVPPLVSCAVRRPARRARPGGAGRVTQVAQPDQEAALMAAFAAGTASAFDTLYQRHKGGVYRYFLRSLSDTGLAEELAQDVWAGLIRARATYRAEAKFTTWLYRLAHHRLIDHYRRANLVVFTALERDDDDDGAPATEPVHPAPGPEDAAAQRAAAQRAVHLVEQLPPAQREALLMQLEGGLTLEEIADATGQGFETIKSRLRYAFAKLRDGLKDHI